MATFMWTADEPKKHSFRKGQGILAKYLPFLDVAFAEMKPRFIQEKRSHYERCGFIPEVVMKHDKKKINKLCLTEKWDHFMHVLTQFHGELIR